MDNFACVNTRGVENLVLKILLTTNETKKLKISLSNGSKGISNVIGHYCLFLNLCPTIFFTLQRDMQRMMIVPVGTRYLKGDT